MDNRKKYQEVFQNVFGVDEMALNEDFTSDQVAGWDSVTQMTLITELEDAFGIMMDTDDIFEFRSYHGGMRILKKYQVEI